MEIVARPEDWTQVDEQRLAEFLNTDTGKRLIPKLTESCPPLLEAGENNAILIRSGMVLAYGKILDNLMMLAHPPGPPAPVQQAYPPLEDDSKWDDGQKLTPAPNQEQTP